MKIKANQTLSWIKKERNHKEKYEKRCEGLEVLKANEKATHPGFEFSFGSIPVYQEEVDSFCQAVEAPIWDLVIDWLTGENG